VKRQYEEKSCLNCRRLFGPKVAKDGRYAWSHWDKQKACSYACASSRPYEEKPCTNCERLFGPKSKKAGGYEWYRWDGQNACSHVCAAAQASAQHKLFGVQLTTKQLYEMIGASPATISKKLKTQTPEQLLRSVLR